KEFLKRRLKKLLIPFIVWTLIVYILQYVILTDTIDATIGGYITAFMNNSIEPIYWFFFAIISLTLAMPVLSLLADNRKILWYMTGVAFLLSGVAPTLFGALHIPWTGAFNIPVAGGYVMYALLGYLVATGDVPKKYRIAIYVAAIACFALRYGYTYISSYNLGFTDRFLFDYYGFYAVFPALAVFLLFKYKNWESPFFLKHAKAITTISGLSFGVYLIHKIILDEIIVGQFGLEYDRILMRIICPIVLYLVSLLIVYLIKKIPILKNIVP
ncbi:MAG: acyltransferase, partial [Raoultibacter sp.]